MAQQIRYLEFPDANTRKTVYYDPEAATEALRITVVVGRLDAGLPLGEGDTSQANDGLAPGAVLIDEYCSLQTPTTGITVRAQDQEPYAYEVADPAAAQCAPPAGACTLAVSAQVLADQVVLTVTGAQGTWRSGVDQVNYAVEADTYPKRATTVTYYVRDAQNCQAQVTVAGDPAPDGQVPPGVKVDSFGSPAIDLYYNAAAGRTLTPYSPTFQFIPDQVTEQERGRADGAEITRFFEGATRVVVYASLFAPFATVSTTTLTPGATLTLERSVPLAPVPPATTGRWQVEVSGGTAPRQLFIQDFSTGPVLLNSEGKAEVSGLPPGVYSATLTDSSSPDPQALTVSFTVPAYVPPAPVAPPGLPEPPAQNLETFPFARAAEPLVDTPDPACADDAYALTVPQTGFLPFCLRRPPDAARWLDCARVVDADTLQELLTFDPRLLGYEKFSDAATDYFLYYGGPVAGLTLPTCRRLRLVVDEFTSVAFQAVSDTADYLLARWWHPQPLQHLPYGTGLQQWLYVPGATLREQAPREERTETKNPSTGTVRVDFLAHARTVSFDTEPLPAWLVQAVQGSRLHASFGARSFAAGRYPVKDVKQTDFGPLSCRRSLTLTLEYPPVTVVGCAAPAPVLAPLPASYASSC